MNKYLDKRSRILDPCCCEEACCHKHSCHCNENRPQTHCCGKPKPCCLEKENLFTPRRPHSCCNHICCPTTCEVDCENLFVSPNQPPCCECCSLSDELCRLIGKKVMICLAKKRGPVYVLDVDEKCVKALAIGPGKIIFINIDSIVSFKEIC